MTIYRVIAHYGVHSAEMGRTTSLEGAVQYATAIAEAMDATGRYEEVLGMPDHIMVVHKTGENEDTAVFSHATGGYAAVLWQTGHHELLGPHHAT